MVNLRDQFVGGASAQTPDTENFVFHLNPSEPQLHQAQPQSQWPSSPYLPLEAENPYLRGLAKGDTGKSPYGYRYYESGDVEQHEMDSFHDRAENRPNTEDDPVGPPVPPRDVRKGSTAQSSYVNPFLHRSEDPFSNQVDLEYPADYPMDYETKELDDRQKTNERARRKLMTRLPRFHYTKLPWFTILVTTIQVIVFIVELARMGVLTGSPFQTKPYFNPMLGPLTYLLINMGARYVPCMHKMTNITLDTLIQYPCPNSTSLATDVCNLNQLCGLSGIPIQNDAYIPHQWYRLITPIFLHAGFLHILFNMMLQITMGVSVEREIGWLKYSIIYMASGVSGFLLGANFAPNGMASTGASGALFGIIATNLLLFVYCGRKNTNLYGTKHYALFIGIMVLEVVVSFVLGLLPGLDNFSHIGGFCMGLLTSVLLLKDPSFVYIDNIYTYDADTTTRQLFINNWNPMNKWEDKIPWKVGAWGGLRLVCLALAIVYFTLLTKSLYSKDMADGKIECKWCKYINCLPVKNWCDQGLVTVTTSTSTPSATATAAAASSTASFPSSIENPNARDLLELIDYDPEEDGIFDRSYLFDTFIDDEVATIGAETETSQYAQVALVLLMAFLCIRYFNRVWGNK